MTFLTDYESSRRKQSSSSATPNDFESYDWSPKDDSSIRSRYLPELTHDILESELSGAPVPGTQVTRVHVTVTDGSSSATEMW